VIDVRVIRYMVTSPVRRRPPPQDPPLTLGIGLRKGPTEGGWYFSDERSTPVAHKQVHTSRTLQKAYLWPYGGPAGG